MIVPLPPKVAGVSGQKARALLQSTSGGTAMLRSIAVLALLLGLYACTTTGNSNNATTGQMENSGGSGGGY
ncbi:MAG: hypothetical protein L0I29_12325 [Hyphomicrobiales bacterium]|nr:hypothetical protein [Hyphomicrobiales bacterium]